MRLTGIVSTVCVPLPEWFKWILGTTGKLRCVPCCGIYPEVGQAVRRGSFSPLRMAPHLTSRLPTVFPTPVRTLLPSHMGTLLQTLFPTPLGTLLQTPISQLCGSLSPAISPKVSEISDTFAATFTVSFAATFTATFQRYDIPCQRWRTLVERAAL